jgi:hypothetical protein
MCRERQHASEASANWQNTKFANGERLDRGAAMFRLSSIGVSVRASSNFRLSARRRHPVCADCGSLAGPWEAFDAAQLPSSTDWLAQSPLSTTNKIARLVTYLTDQCDLGSLTVLRRLFDLHLK